MSQPVGFDNADHNFSDSVQPHHLTEWRDSSVDDQLTALNLLSLVGTEPKNHLFCFLPNSERRNDGRVRDKWLHRYAHTEAGGCWISGLDPHNGWQKWDIGRFKPDTPRLDRNGKTIKYESQPKSESHPTYFDVPNHIWDKVAKRYRIKRYRSPLSLRLADKLPPSKHSSGYSLTHTGAKRSLSDCLRGGVKPAPFLPPNLQSPSEPNPEPTDNYCFWSWVANHPEIPILLTEGEKKAACLLSLGFVAVALPGIWMGRVKNQETGTDYLHPDLMPMVSSGRKFIILFDNDEKPSTRHAVHLASVFTGKVIEAAGASCSIASLPEGSEKGVDDFVTANGKRALSLIAKIVDRALTLKDYLRKSRKKTWGLSKKYPANVTLNTRYLSDALRLPETGLIAIESGMGTGKTELLAKLRREHPRARFLNVGHRVNLMKNLSERLATQMYSEISQGQLAKALSLSITVDSLYKLQTQFNEYDCVFIDEACQNLAHLLHSNTCKEHRAEILEVLEYIIGKAKLVVLADAHMNDVTVDFFRAMRPEVEVPFIIKNEYKQGGREVHFYEGDDSSALVAKISCALMMGLKIMVVSDSKKFIKKLEAMMTVQVDEERTLFEPETGVNPKNGSHLRIWSIHADNSGSNANKAFIKDISTEVKNVDALLASPSLGTGVDICDYHFDAVFGAFHAVSQSATECCQALHRYRHQVALHIWVAPRPPFGYQETNAEKIKERMLQLNQMTAFLIRVDKNNGQRGAEKDWALNAYCEIEASRNYSINNLRDDLLTLLEEMAYKITTVESDSDAMVKNKMLTAGRYLDTAHQLAVVNASDISQQEYLSRQAKNYLEPEEIVECEKYRLQRDYGLPVTEELVRRDGSGCLISQLIALESLLANPQGKIVDPKTNREYPAPPQIVADKDLKERDNLPLCMDWHNYSSKWLARYNLGLPSLVTRLLEGEEICANDPDVKRMAEAASASRVHIKAILNLTIPENCKPMWLVGVLIGQLGLKTVSRKKGKRGEQVRYYCLAKEDTTFALKVLQYRIKQREEKARKELEQQQKNSEHQARMQAQYGVEPPQESVSTPPDKEGIYTPGGDMDTDENWIEKSKIFLSRFNSELEQKLSRYLSILRGDDLGEKGLNCSF